MINRNFLTIVENVGSNIQDTSTAMETIIKRLVNEIYFDLLRRTNFEICNYDYSFVASTRDNVLPTDFGKEIAVYDSTNLVTLTRTNQHTEIDNFISTIGSTGTIGRYAIFDSPVRVQPSTSGTITFASSSASDNTQTIFIRGYLNGVEISETLTLSGTTGVTSTNSYDRYRAISKSAVTIGTITGTQGTDSIVIMSPEMIDCRYKIMRFYEAPATATTIKCPYIISPLPMSNDYDTPILDCADTIELGATMRAWQYKRQFAKAQEFKKLYEQGISNLIWDRANQPNDINLFNFQSYSRDTA